MTNVCYNVGRVAGWTPMAGWISAGSPSRTLAMALRIRSTGLAPGLPAHQTVTVQADPVSRSLIIPWAQPQIIPFQHLASHY